MICLVGSSPSSGSTFLADLLDSSGFSASGEETKLFANKKLFRDFKRFDINNGFKMYFLHSFGKVYKNRVCKYGMNLDEVNGLLKQSENINEFSKLFALKYLALRGKNIEGIFFEKTPENLNVIDESLDVFGKFITIVRHPLYVYKSLIRRGYPKYIALLTWLVDNSKLIRYKNDSRVIIVKYENLVKSPYKTVKNIFDEFGFSLKEDEIEKFYKNNFYRKYCTTKLKEWNVKGFGEIKNANLLERVSKEDLKDMGKLINLKITKEYAGFFDTEEISFKELIDFFGYEIDYIQSEPLMPNISEIKWMLRRWKYDMKFSEAGLEDREKYVKVVECVR